jgi:hypothetical protein
MNLLFASLQRNTIYTFLFVQLMCFSINPSSFAQPDKLLGEWKGEFMPGNNLIMVLRFEQEGNASIQERVLLFQGQTQIQDDKLKDIKNIENAISFIIEAKQTPFKGIIKNDTILEGEFTFPDGSLQPVLLKYLGVTPQADVQQIKLDPLSAKFSVSQLNSDLDFLINQLISQHPALFKYTREDTFKVAYETVSSKIEAGMSEDEFFRLIAPIVELANCAHTGIRLSKSFNTAIQQKQVLLPFEIKIINNKAFVIHNFSNNEDIKPGAEIININNISIPEIINRLLSAIPSDGGNLSGKLFSINESFSLNYLNYLGIDSVFMVEYRYNSGEIKSAELTGITPADFEKSIIEANPPLPFQGKMPVSIDIETDKKLAILRVSGFWAPDFNAYNTFLENTFKQLEIDSVQTLIVDVRGNKGGHPYFAAELISYLARESFVYFSLPEEQGEFAPLFKPLKPKSLCFDGDIFVVMDGGCLSSTGHFLSLIKYHKMGWLVGEPSGSTFTCNDGSLQFSLPETGIEMNVPQITFETAIQGLEAGKSIQPDYPVTYHLEDYLRDNNPAINFIRGRFIK